MFVFVVPQEYKYRAPRAFVGGCTPAYKLGVVRGTQKHVLFFFVDVIDNTIAIRPWTNVRFQVIHNNNNICREHSAQQLVPSPLAALETVLKLSLSSTAFESQSVTVSTSHPNVAFIKAILDPRGITSPSSQLARAISDGYFRCFLDLEPREVCTQQRLPMTATDTQNMGKMSPYEVFSQVVYSALRIARHLTRSSLSSGLRSSRVSCHERPPRPPMVFVGICLSSSKKGSHYWWLHHLRPLIHAGLRNASNAF